MVNNIEKYRVQKGLSVEELSRRTGLSVPQVYYWQRKEILYPASLNKIASALSVEPESLLSNDATLSNLEDFLIVLKSIRSWSQCFSVNLPPEKEDMLLRLAFDEIKSLNAEEREHRVNDIVRLFIKQQQF